MDVALAIEALVPAAEYRGSVTSNTRESLDEIEWLDDREKPTWDQLTTVVLITPEAIAERRYEAEISGTMVSGIRIETDDRSKLLINGATVEAMLDPDYALRWKANEGFVDLSAAQIITVARAVRAHVQACFDREAELLAELSAGTLTDDMVNAGWP